MKVGNPELRGHSTGSKLLFWDNTLAGNHFGRNTLVHDHLGRKIWTKNLLFSRN